jgi:Rad3-related DNA helicase
MGKTLVYCVVAALKWRHFETRTIVSTFTRQLREEICKEAEVVKEILKSLGYNRNVEIKPYIALSAACSLENANSLCLRYPDNKDACDYRDWVKGEYADTTVPFIDDYISGGGNLDFLYPVSTSHTLGSPLEILTYRYGTVKKNIKNPHGDVEITLKKQHDENRKAVDDANTAILVVTHAMFIRNANDFGVILNTNKIDYNRKATEFLFDVIIDEADLYNQQALNYFDNIVSMSDVNEALSNNPSGKKLKIKKSVENLQNHFSSVRSRYQIRSEEISLVLSLITKVIEDFDKKITKMPLIDYIERDELRKLRSQLQTFVSIFEDDGKSNGAFKPSDHVNFFSSRHDQDIHMSLISEKGHHIASRPWRNIKVHAFEHIAMVSGTITDENRKSMTTFCSLTGIYHKDDKGDMVWHEDGGYGTSKPSIIVPLENRGIDKLVYSSIDIVPHNGENLNPDYWEYVSKSILGLMCNNGMPNNNILVLMTSYRAQEQLKKSLEKGGIKNAIFQTRGGARQGVEKVKKYHNGNQKFIVFSLNWNGVNYVDNGKTLIDSVVFPVIPFPTKRPHDNNYHSVYGSLASHKIRQGMGRALRNNGDKPEFWFLDARLPVSKNLRSKYFYTKCGASKSNSALSVSLTDKCCLEKSKPDVYIVVTKDQKQTFDLKKINP